MDWVKILSETADAWEKEADKWMANIGQAQTYLRANARGQATQLKRDAQKLRDIVALDLGSPVPGMSAEAWENWSEKFGKS